MEDFDKGLNSENSKNDELPAGRDGALSSEGERKAANASGGGFSAPAEAANGQVVFHYSREHRLSRANPELRRVYEEGYNLNKGFIKGLTGNAGLRSTFMVIIILCAAIGLISFFGPSSDEASFYGADASLRAFSFGENVFVSVFIASNDELPAPFPAMVAAELSVLDGDGAILTAAIVTGWYSGEETVLRYSFPDYEGATVTAVLYVIGDGMEDAISESEAASVELSAKIRRE